MTNQAFALMVACVEIQPVWQTEQVATSLHQVLSTDSTQAEARRMIAAGHGHGLLVVAATQTDGRGRFTRAWHSPPGNLYASFVLQPPLPVTDWPQIMMCATLALVEAVESLTTLPAQLKWPNDLLLAERKAAGLLAEIEGEYLILGVGVNVNAVVPAMLTTATSLSSAAGVVIDIQHLLTQFVTRFDQYVLAWLRGARFEQLWAARLQTLGQTVQVRMGVQLISGVAESVQADGSLNVRCADGRRVTCHAGEVTLRAPSVASV